MQVYIYSPSVVIVAGWSSLVPRLSTCTQTNGKFSVSLSASRKPGNEAMVGPVCLLDSEGN